jgi:hypothetical protein
VLALETILYASRQPYLLTDLIQEDKDQGYKEDLLTLFSTGNYWLSAPSVNIGVSEQPGRTEGGRGRLGTKIIEELPALGLAPTPFLSPRHTLHANTGKASTFCTHRKDCVS